jgi:hypothetical protein
MTADSVTGERSPAVNSLGFTLSRLRFADRRYSAYPIIFQSITSK